MSAARVKVRPRTDNISGEELHHAYLVGFSQVDVLIPPKYQVPHSFSSILRLCLELLFLVS